MFANEQRVGDPAAEAPARRIVVRGVNDDFVNNSLSTNKYSFTKFYKKNFFLWKAVLEQFKRCGELVE